MECAAGSENTSKRRLRATVTKNAISHMPANACSRSIVSAQRPAWPLAGQRNAADVAPAAAAAAVMGVQGSAGQSRPSWGCGPGVAAGRRGISNSSPGEYINKTPREMTSA